MKKRLWIMGALVVVLALVLAFALLSPRATEPALAQGLCEYGTCGGYWGFEFVGYRLLDVAEPKLEGGCLVFEVAKEATDGQADFIFQPVNGDAISGSTPLPILVCGNVINYASVP